MLNPFSSKPSWFLDFPWSLFSWFGVFWHFSSIFPLNTVVLPGLCPLHSFFSFPALSLGNLNHPHSFISCLVFQICFSVQPRQWWWLQDPVFPFAHPMDISTSTCTNLGLSPLSLYLPIFPLLMYDVTQSFGSFLNKQEMLSYLCALAHASPSSKNISLAHFT